MDTNSDNTFLYKAFISYKREDLSYAKWFQQQLENYHVPKKVRKEHPELPERLGNFFRDTTDLSGRGLETAIKEGLESSEYLIVICSPRAANSEWVCKEVSYFCSLGRADKIIAVIIDGIPHSSDPAQECFPKSLLKEPVGYNINEAGKHHAFIKVVATMLDVPFDVLWQRHLRAQRRRMYMTVCSLIAIIGILVALVFALLLANRSMSKERDGMLAAQSRAVAQQAMIEIGKGEVLNSIMALLEVMPEDLDNPDRPYVPEADAALRAALDSLHFSNGWLTHTLDNDVEDVHWTHDGKHIVCVSLSTDTTTSVSLYSASTFTPENSYILPVGALMTHVSKDDKSIAIQTGDGGQMSVYSLGDGRLLQKVTKKSKDVNSWFQKFSNTDLEKYILEDKIKAEFKLGDDLEVVDYSSRSGLALVRYNTRWDPISDVTTFSVLDIQSKSIIWTENLTYAYGEPGIALSPSGKYLAIYFVEYIFDKIDAIRLVDLTTLHETSIPPPRQTAVSEFRHVYWTSDDRYLVYETLDCGSWAINITTRSVLQPIKDGDCQRIRGNSKGDKLLCTQWNRAVLTYKNTPKWRRECAYLPCDFYANRGDTIGYPLSSDKYALWPSVTIEPDTLTLFPPLIKREHYYARDEVSVCYEIMCDSLHWFYANGGYYLQPLCNLHQGKYLVVQENASTNYGGIYRDKVIVLDSYTGVKVMEFKSKHDTDTKLLRVNDSFFAIVQHFYSDATLYEFPSYPDLIAQCRAYVKGMALTPEARKRFLLE